MFKIAMMISGTGTNAEVITRQCLENRIDAEVVCYGSDKFDIKGFDFAKKNNIFCFTVDYKKIISSFNSEEFILPEDFNYEEIEKKLLFCPVKNVEKYIKTRAVCEKIILDNLFKYSPDLLVLAGFMRTFSPYFIDRFSPDPFKPRIMNIHPALLPAFPGVDGYGDTFFYGCKKGGCTVHFVDYGTDSGPVIVQKSFDIQSNESIDDIRKKGIELEWKAYPEAISLFVSNKLEIIENKREIANGKFESRRIVKINN
ncbi:MAG: phosphoribosylglycinamide formyltransferase [Deltaproteobacteria bacterium]|nr:MAG: phosphoribosylglycinamide formyltransferase [Deltaproteobacteria bacterium]